MRKPRILIADDEEGIRESLRLILEDHYEVEFAEDGQAAFARLARETFDLALLDIKMPKLDGLQVMKRLREMKAALPPILILTAYQCVEVAKEAVKLGATGYLAKPFEREDILKAIRDTLQETVQNVKSKSNCKK